MFDLSWVELAFCAALALIVVGPKDLPKLIKSVGQAVRKAKRMYRDFLGSVNKLEKEIDVASGNQQSNQAWLDLMPEHLRNLPENFSPGNWTAEQHQQHQTAVDVARKQAQATYEETLKNQQIQNALVPEAQATDIERQTNSHDDSAATQTKIMPR